MSVERQAFGGGSISSAIGNDANHSDWKSSAAYLSKARGKQVVLYFLEEAYWMHKERNSASRMGLGGNWER